MTLPSYFQLMGAEAATHNILAYRHDLDLTNSIKIEINKNEPDAAGSVDDTTFVVQWSFCSLNEISKKNIQNTFSKSRIRFTNH